MTYMIRRSPQHREVRSVLNLLLAFVLLLSSVPLLSMPSRSPDAVVAPPVVAPPAVSVLPNVDAPSILPSQLLSTPEIVGLREEYARHYDLGNGKRVAVVGLEPLNYRDAAGQWQPIAPAFSAVADGWRVTRNSLQSHLAARGTAVQLTSNNLAIGWQPRALAVRDSADTSRDLATPLPPAQAAPGTLADDGSTLRFAGAWSDPALTEELQSGPGMLEQRLVLAQPPRGIAEAQWLELRADLTLPAGAHWYADGQVQHGAFVTSGALELRAADGTALLAFAPPVAYEQANQDARVAGRYRVLPNAQGATLLVQTPAAWWADPIRQYPAVLDPTMQVVKAAIEGRTVWDAELGSDGPYFADEVINNKTGAPLLAFQDDKVCVGHANPLGRGYERGYFTFPFLPTLPQGVQPTKIQLVGTPIPALSVGTSGPAFVDGVARHLIDARGLLEPWVGNPKLPGQYQKLFDDGIANGQEIVRPQTYDPNALPATVWDVTQRVQQWYANPATNYGFMLRLSGNDERFLDVLQPLPSNPATRRAFNSCFPKLPQWSNLDSVVNNPNAPTTDGAGLGMLVTYDAPVAQRSFLVEYSKIPSPLPPNTYANQYHEYQFPYAARRWQFMAAQSPVNNNGEITPANTPLTLVHNGNVELTSQVGRVTPGNSSARWLTNYVAINGYRAPAADDRVRVQPDTSLAPGSELGGYYTQSIDANPSPALPVNAPQPLTLALGSGPGLVTAQELNLQADTTVEIKFPYPDEVRNPAQDYNLQVFAPTNSYASRAKAGQVVTAGADGWEIEFPVTEKTQGTWALVLAIDTGPGYLRGGLEGQITTCQNSKDVVRYPLDGKCVELQRPPANFSADAGKYQQVGKVSVYSPGGFSGNCSTSCTTNLTANGVPAMPLIGWAGDDAHWVALKSGALTINGNTVTTAPDTRLLLVDFSDASTINTLPVLQGQFRTDVATGVLRAIGAKPDGLLVNSPLPQDNTSTWNYTIDLPTARMRAAGPLTRAVEPTPGSKATFAFNAEWSIDVRGGPSLQGSLVLNGVSPRQFNVGPLIYTPPATGYTFEADPTTVAESIGAATPQFTQIRMVNGFLRQPPELGSAGRPDQQAVLLPPGIGVMDASGNPIALQCGTSCFDLRGPGDTISAINRTYPMPDIIVQNTANTVMVNTADGVNVMSSDHPQAAPGEKNSLGLNFEAFNGKIETYQGPCPITNPKNSMPAPKPVPDSAANTTVIRGSAGLKLPTLNTDGPEAGNDTEISSTFTLCENSLRQVTFTFSTGDETGVPVGPLPVFVNFVGGTVDIIPSGGGQQGYTTVKLDVRYRATEPSAQGSQIFGKGIVTIDSRGLFDLQAQTGIKVFADVGAANDGHFWVAWSPMDIGFETTTCAPYRGTFNPAEYADGGQLCTGNELLVGSLRAHMWKGQGWQNKYTWLRDDGATHIAARYTADINLKAGFILDWAFVKVPPSDTTLNLTLAFGEFCTNAACDTYEWGVMGSVGVLGYDVGVYYGFKSGMSFILGSNSHTLIDEAGGQAQLRGVTTQASATTVTIKPNAPSAMFGMAWTEGTPQLTIRDPDGRVIDSTSTGPDLVITKTRTREARQDIIVVQNPKPGDWQIDITGGTPGTYRAFQFANTNAPDLKLTIPGTFSITANTKTIPVSWTSSNVDPATNTRLSLYYELLKGGNVLTSTQIITAGLPIIERIPLTPSGTVQWNAAGLPSGTYKVYGRIDNNAAAVVNDCLQGAAPEPPSPDGETPRQYNPDPTKQTCGTMLNTGLTLSRERVDAPLPITIANADQPSTVDGVTARPEGNTSVTVRWTPSKDADVAGYLITCQQGRAVRVVRVLPRYGGTSTLKEQVRVNGLIANMPANCSVQAIDVDDTVGPASGNVTVTPSANIPAPLGAVPALTVTPQGSQVTLSWAAVPGAAGYLVSYSPVLTSDDPTGGYQAKEGASPIDVGNVTTYTLTGLRPGVTYAFAVRAYDGDGRYGTPSDQAEGTVGTDTPTLPTEPGPTEFKLFLPMIMQ